MRYFIDTEFNDQGGDLLSLALVREDGKELYVQVPFAGEEYTDWVRENVLPVMSGTPEYPAHPAKFMHRKSATIAVGTFLASDPEPIVLADHPVDIAHLCQLLDLGGGKVFPIDALQMVFFNIEDFSTRSDSRVPHNALWDARALALHILGQEQALEVPTEECFAPLVDMAGDVEFPLQAIYDGMLGALKLGGCDVTIAGDLKVDGNISADEASGD